MPFGNHTLFVVLANFNTLIDVLLFKSASDDNEVFLLQSAQSLKVFASYLPLLQKDSQAQ